MTAYIKYQPLSNYHWNTLLEGTGKLKNYLYSIAPFSVYLPPKIATKIQLALSALDVSSEMTARSVVQCIVAVGNQVDPKIGLLIHSVHSLVKTENFATAAIDLLTLASFVKMTKRQALLVSLAQAIIQSMQSFYDAYEEKEDSLKLYSSALLGCLHLNRAMGYYQDIQDLAGKIFIIMRHADRERIGDESQILPKGYERCKEAANTIGEIQVEYEKEDIQFTASSLIRSQQTAQAVGKEFNVTDIAIDPRLRERENKSGISRKERKNHPQFIAYSALSKEQQFYNDPLPGKESDFTTFSRMKEGVESALDKTEGETLPVIVSHSQSMRIWLKGLQKFGHDVSNEFLKGTKYCEIIVMVLKTDGVFKALDRILVNLTV